MREQELLDHVYRTSGDEAEAGGRVIVGPGDDMAVVDAGSTVVLMAVDQVIDGRHFVLGRDPLALIGRKAVTRSLSDIAAMAARPVAALAAAALPPDLGAAQATALFDAMRETARAYGCPLVGGDIALYEDGAAPLTCGVTVLAEPGPTPPVLRGRAQVGDEVYVTGVLGGAAAGHHLTFAPRIAEALALAATLGSRLHAMLDLSDGLGRDGARMATASDVRLELEAAALPARPGSTWRGAAGDGEDYELLFAATGDVPPSVGEVPVTRIGRVLPPAAGAPRTVFVHGEERVPGDELGWEHRSS